MSGLLPCLFYGMSQSMGTPSSNQVHLQSTYSRLPLSEILTETGRLLFMQQLCAEAKTLLQPLATKATPLFWVLPQGCKA